jgi:hypothetical protein
MGILNMHLALIFPGIDLYIVGMKEIFIFIIALMSVIVARIEYSFVKSYFAWKYIRFAFSELMC